MAKAPNPDVQCRNIRLAWSRLSPDDQLDLAIELFGSAGPEPTTKVEEVLVEVVKPMNIDDTFNHLDMGGKVELLDRLFTAFAVKIDLDADCAQHVLELADKMRELKLCMGGG